MAYLPRAERLDLSFPVEFRGADGRMGGSCLNVSESGMLAQFRLALELWTEGELWVEAGVTQLLIRVRVARVEDRQAGLAFRFADEDQRAKVRAVVAFAARNTGLAGGAPPF